jgi:hypothetical protein
MAMHLPTCNQQLSLTATEPVKNYSLAMMDFPSKEIMKHTSGQSAAEFDGHGAGQKLLARYDGFSQH